MSDDIEERMHDYRERIEKFMQSPAYAAEVRRFELRGAVVAAEERLHNAALVVGKHFHDETDARWPEVHEYEAAALGYYKAVRAEQEGA